MNATLHEPSWDDARAAAHAAARPTQHADVPITAGLGLVLAAPLVARIGVPGFDTSMMDGWAVSGDGPWRVVGRVLAGSVPAALATGEAIGIATGAPVPAGALAVLRREWGTELDGLLTPAREPEPGEDIRRAGDEAHDGDALLPTGTRVTPPVIGLAALVGLDTLRVHLAPSMEVLVLGDEVVTSGIPEPGHVRDALGVQVLAWSDPWRCERRGVRHVADTLDAHIDALRTSTADIVCTTGGTARGPVDHMHAALAALGARLIVDEVRVRPGHPMLLAELPDGRFVVGLPGNPLAAVAAFLTLAEPLLQAMAGLPLGDGDTCATTGPIQAPASDRRLMPARRHGDSATPTEFWGSAMLRGIAQSDCMLVTEPGGAQAGDRVRVLALPW